MNVPPIIPDHMPCTKNVLSNFYCTLKQINIYNSKQSFNLKILEVHNDGRLVNIEGKLKISKYLDVYLRTLAPRPNLKPRTAPTGTPMT